MLRFGGFYKISCQTSNKDQNRPIKKGVENWRLSDIENQSLTGLEMGYQKGIPF